MPVDAGGNATRPPSPIPVSGQTADAPQVNVPINDIYSILNMLVFLDGRKPLRGNIPMNGHRARGAGDAEQPQDYVTLGQIPALLAAQAVLYTTQTLTPEQQAQARDNIGITAPSLWVYKPLFEPFPLYINPSTDTTLLPPNSPGGPRFIEMTAGKSGAGQYNNGLLTGESVTGSGALVQATAQISLPESPKNGATIRLINTESRFVRAGVSAGTVQNDAMQRITGFFEGRALVDGPRLAGGAFHLRNSTSSNTAQAFSGSSTGNSFGFDSGNSPSARVSDDETRVKNMSAVYFMRIS